MQEFVKKLIERLEEEIFTCQSAYAESVIGMCGKSAENYISEMHAFEKTKKIVNQLAEEYKNESVKGDLISRSELLKELESNKLQPTKDTDGFIDGWCEGFNTVVGMIRNQPTAFDTEKVVEQLEEVNMNYFLTIANTGSEKLDIAYGYASDSINKVIDIVKKGGVE